MLPVATDHNISARLSGNDGSRTFMDIPKRPLLRVRKRLHNRYGECIRNISHSSLSTFHPLVVVPVPACLPKTHIYGSSKTLVDAQGWGEKKVGFCIAYLRQWPTVVLFMLLGGSQQGLRSNCHVSNLVSEKKDKMSRLDRCQFEVLQRWEFRLWFSGLWHCVLL